MTTATAQPAKTLAAPRPAQFMKQLSVTTKLMVVERLRTPAAVIPNTIFPTLVFLFFVLPQSGVTQDPVLAVTAVTQLASFGVMSSLLFGYGIGVAEERSSSWNTYLRTLPSNGLPAIFARAINALLFCALALLPLLVISALTTKAPEAFTDGTLEGWRLPAGILAVLISGLPFLGLGLLIGYLCSSKSSVAVVQVVFFPLAFAGGMMLPPQMFPNWLDVVSRFLPSREARDISISITTGAPMDRFTPALWLDWVALLFGAAWLAYKRDQGQRFH